MRLLIFILLGLAGMPGIGIASYANGYTYRRTITIDHTKVDTADQANFPVYVPLTTANAGASFGSHVTSSFGYDLVFTSDSAGSTLLTWDLEYYDGVANIALAHVNIPSLSHTVDTVIYLFYGNGGVTSPQSLDAWAWNSAYVGVFHFRNGVTLDVDDSTAVGTGGTAVGGAGPSTDGIIDGSLSLVSASSQYVTIGNNPPSPGNLTVSAWVKATSFPGTLNSIVVKDQVGVGSFAFYARNTGTLAVFTGSGNATTGSHTLSTGVWYYVVFTWDSVAGLWVYVNGAVDQTVGGTGTLSANSATTAIGNDLTAGGRFWNGLIDEVRFSNVARSGPWIATEYNNQSAPATFFAVGTETTQASAAGRRRVIAQ